MGMPHAAERWTADQVRALPDDGNRYELVSGELVVTPAPRASHQVAVSELEAWLRRAVNSPGAPVGVARLHVLHSPADISLGEDEVLQPDLFVYATASGRLVRDWSEIDALFLVIEVLSPSTARYDRVVKRVRYQRAGVPEYWVVDLDARIIECWRPGDERPQILAERISWQAGAAAPAAELALPLFFATVLGDDAVPTVPP
jgi:Uma2 family endonuclease